MSYAHRIDANQNTTMRNNPNIALRGDHNECPSCGKLFNSTLAFDKHRTGDFGKDRRCRTTEEMVLSGMAESRSGFWVSRSRDNASVNRARGARIDECA
jgi:hypothetical protein